MKLLLPFIRLFRRQSLMMFVGLLLTVTTLMAGIGLLSLSGWFLSATAVAGLALATAETFNYFTPAGGVRFLSIARTASRYGERLATHEATFRILTDLRLWAWRSLLPLSERNLSGMRRGDLLNRLVADIDTLDHLYLRLLTPLTAFLLMLLALTTFIGWFDLNLAILLCTGLLLSWLLLPSVFYLLGRQPGRELIEARRSYRVRLLEWLSGQAELSLFSDAKDGAAESFRAELDRAEQSWFASQKAMAAITGLSQAMLILCHGLLVLLLLWFAAAGVGPAVPPGPLLAMVLFATLACIEMMMPLAGAFQHLSSVLLAAKRVSELTEQRSDIEFPAVSAAMPESGALIIKDVHFGYTDTQPVLQGLSLQVSAGSKVALLGKTGSGKSSLLALITRQWQPQQGEILLGGVPVASLDEKTLRASMTVVSQRVQLLSASLRDNLQLALPEKVTDDTLAEVLRQVGLEGLLEGEGLNAWIGEGGRQLSGGEQRRIGVARALLRDAPLLLLDEPTEGLDRRTEQEILKLLLQFAKDKTLVMISHRLTGMAQMDAIHLLDEGKIVSSGSHEQLLQESTAYSALYQRLH
ncbi:heme ABC transporter ATP-binding protein/permease CydC [Shewanella algae]|uniref:heme ABC transporter ATP-binding protein/permease CydC n=1 Tax=Shewanella algae TaxID=38313 RepID=UPI000468354F|nr:cysteine/glutathione ABC transporter ATP-binding protein/permease CydC [Shewanella algae]MBO2563982.1 cysteine/glutathione ABC transporter ATP-binding protein/permease CydC [Shewanella algae]NKZ41505.1 cysteine/glutathione ABC transporter ATP-binding protein/permease CydC [Shewanella algae]QTE78804.1 cysteine/glutathione ABC transporter ATP-binding protein/permease CydC [Shewanella algae]TVK99671.1 amino acid ABC transporter ATP-binding protein [Shewanella algae]